MVDYEAHAKFGILGCCIIINFIWPFLLGFSFDTISPGEVGLLHNENIGRLGETPPRAYGRTPDESGRYFTGLGQGFKTFPTTLQRIVMSAEANSTADAVDSRTKDGLKVTLALAFQYRLKTDPENLLTMYQAYGDDWEDFYVTYARSEVRDVVSEFRVRSLWTNRTEIGVALETRMRQVLDEHWAVLDALQILSLTIPKQVQDAIENTAIEAQRIQQAQFEVEVEAVQANTTVLEAEQEMRTLVLAATGDARNARITAQAEANSTLVSTRARWQGHQAIKSNLSLTEPQLLDLVWLESVKAAPATLRTVVNLGVPSSFKAKA